MGAVGSFLKGVIAGVAGLGLVSWFIATQCGEENEESDQEEE